MECKRCPPPSAGLQALLFLLLICCFLAQIATSSAEVERSENDSLKIADRQQEQELYLGNDQLYIQFYAHSPSSKMMFNGTTYEGTAFYTNVLWSHLTDGAVQFPVPTEFSFTKTQVPNKFGNGTLLQRVTFNATINNGSVLLADAYLTNEPLNLTLSSSGDNVTSLREATYTALDQPVPTKVPSRLVEVTPDGDSTTIQLGANALLVKLRVQNWHYASTSDRLTLAGSVESSASGIDVFWSKYPPPTNNMATVGLPGGPKVVVVHLMNNATMSCDGDIRSVYVDTRYDLKHILSPVAADIRLIFPSLDEVFTCRNASNDSVPCECRETFIDYVVYMELDKWETVVRWWLIAGIVVLAVSGFLVLICVFLCVARRYNRALAEDQRKEQEAAEEAGTGVAVPARSEDEEEGEAKTVRTWRRPDLTPEEEADPLLRFVYKKKAI